jgi:hypothetical protein
VKPAEGIAANRWATRVEQVMDALKSPASERMGAVRVLNSWGRDGYPHRVWMPLETLQRLLDEEGEATVVTDLLDEEGEATVVVCGRHGRSTSTTSRDR